MLDKIKFINVLSLLFITLTFSYDICLFFVDFPAANRDVVIGIANVINSGGLITILNYFFGSSKSSENKNQIISSLINQQNPPNPPNNSIYLTTTTTSAPIS